MPGLQLCLAQRLQLELSLRLRQCLLLAPSLRLDTDSGNHIQEELKYLATLAKLNQEELSKKLKRDSKKQGLAFSLKKYLSLKKSIDPFREITRFQNIGQSGYHPSEYLEQLNTIALTIQEETRELFFGLVDNWVFEKYLFGIALLFNLLSNLLDVEAFFAVVNFIHTEKNLKIIEKADMVKDILPRKPTGDRKILFALKLVSEEIMLIPQHQRSIVRCYREHIMAIIASEDTSELLNEKISPLLTIPFYVILRDDTAAFRKFLSLANDDYIQRSRDNLRALIFGLNALDTDKHLQLAVLRHCIKTCSTAKEFIKVFRLLPAFIQSQTEFNFAINTPSELIKHLSENGLALALTAIGLTKSEKTTLLENYGRLNRRDTVSILLKLAEVYNLKSYRQGLALIKEIILKLINKTYAGYRYEHQESSEQLECLDDVDSWKSNQLEYFQIGDYSGIKEHRKRVSRFGNRLEKAFSAAFKGLSISKHRKELREIVNQIKEAKDQTAKFEAIARKNFLQKVSDIREAIRQVYLYNLEGYGRFTVTAKILQDCADYPELQGLFLEVKEVIGKYHQLQFEIESYTIAESDDLYDLLNMGVAPIQTCQRYFEQTGYNQALLSFVLDGNKKMITVRKWDNLVCRLFLRLQPLDIEEGDVLPMIIIERPYALAWSNDFGKNILSFIIKKAKLIARFNGGYCALGFSNTDQNNPLWDIFKASVSKKQKFLRHQKKMRLTASRNGYEYSDALVGAKLIESGSDIQCDLNIVIIGEDD